MRLRHCSLLLLALFVVFGSNARPRAVGPAAALYGIGQLTGLRETPASLVRDATQVGGVIYAVGGATTRLCTATSGLCGDTDTAVLWQFDGTNPATLQALPNIFPNLLSTTPVTAYAITPDKAFIASQARTNAANGRQAVRVATSSLTNLNLNALFPALGGTLTAATATSSNGAILYGSTNEGTFNPLFPHRGVRLDATGATSQFIPFLFPTDTWNPVAERGTSADGSVAVGSSFDVSPLGVITNHRAYRYVYGSSLTAIPLLSGGTFNDAVAVSADGNVVLVTGNSTANPKGEAYLWRASDNTKTPLGSPNSGLFPGAKIASETSCLGGPVFSGGMTADLSVVAMSFFGGACGGTTGYFRNAHGWFHLTSVLVANGVDLLADGWDSEKGLEIHGISPDGTLVFGAGVRNGNIEGFVATFGAGVLASFNPQPAAPGDTSLVGAWTCGPDASAPKCVLVFTADGAYYHIEGSPTNPSSGFERGYYTFGSPLTFTTLVDTNGSTGVSSANGFNIPATVVDDTLILGGDHAALRIPGSAGTLVGAWMLGDPTQPDNSVVIVFTSGGKFVFAQDGSGTGSSRDSIEIGTFTWDAGSGLLVPDVSGGVDQNGDGGLASSGLTITANLTANGLGLVLAAGSETFQFTRVIDPATIPVIANTPLSANGVEGQAFSYDVDATNTVTFTATGLPDGLSIDSVTGQISGTPTVGGQFAVDVFATNAAGVSDIETLTLTIAIPTPVGSNVVVEPEVPEGQGPITLTFDEITTEGTTTVKVVDLEESGIPLPGNVEVGGVVYEITTTATFQGLINLCFSYAGIDFGDASPRLFHFEDGVWVDITTSVDPVTQTICGATTSLSPFAVLVSDVVRKGFHAPVNPLAGYLNIAKGGSTVPLKFNVYVNGVEKTTTTGLDMTIQQINCDSSAPEDDVEPAAVTGGTGLRYAGGSFIFNWKIPNTPGRCYMVRMTTTQDELALTARFKVK